MKLQLALFIVFAFVAVGCSQQELQKVQSASDTRSQLCTGIGVTAIMVPDVDLSKPMEACRKSDQLRDVAAAIGGCYEPPAPATEDPKPAGEAPATEAPSAPAEPVEVAQ